MSFDSDGIGLLGLLQTLQDIVSISENDLFTVAKVLLFVDIHRILSVEVTPRLFTQIQSEGLGRGWVSAPFLNCLCEGRFERFVTRGVEGISF